MVTIDVLEHVDQCYSNQDGLVIQKLIRKAFDEGEIVVVSLKGITALNSSFVNTAFIDLLEFYDFNQIKTQLKIVNSTKKINEFIKSRFQDEVNERKKLIKA